jgi:tocopherol O-methyltransferase
VIRSCLPIEPAAVAAHYDDLDPFYREVWGEHVHHGLWLTGRESSEEAVAQLSRKVAERAAIGHASRVCDVGCGYGATARLLELEYGASVTGITVSRRQHEAAVARSGATPVFILGDWLHNDLPGAAFDAVIAIESTEHMENKPRFFEEAARVLRPGGRLVVCGWLAANRLPAFSRRHLIERICLEGRMPGIGTEGDYRAWMAEAGFLLDHFEDVSRRVERTWAVCVRRFICKVARDPRYLRFLLRRGEPNRIFAVTLFRILIAYKTNAMRYGIFSGTLQMGGISQQIATAF